MVPGSALRLAASSPTSGSSAGTSILILVVLVAIFYFLLIRPQRRRMRQHQDLVSTLGRGDEVVTIGGIIGYIQDIGEDDITVEIADGCVIRVVKQAIARKAEDRGRLESGSPAGEAPAGSDWQEESGGGLEEPGGSDDT
jgi:preprotein translocase subunit YajC